MSLAAAQRGTAKVILIGLDSADQHLVEQGCDSGDLPVLRSLRDRGAYGLLSGFAALADDALWASFYTGLSPGRHGRYFWNYPEPGTYEHRLYRDRKPSLKPFWAQLSQSGLRSAIIDVPKCPLVRELNGVQVADWLVHGRDHPETCSWPVELAGDLLRRFGDDRTDRVDRDWLCRMHSLQQNELEKLQQYLLDGLEKKTAFACELLEENWDLFLIVFKEAHCMGHQAWHLLDAAGGARSLGSGVNAVQRIYQALDCAIGEIARTAGPETALIVFSNLGMAPNYTGEHLLDEMLRRLESKIATPWQRSRLAARRATRKLRALIRGDAESSLAPANRLAFQLEHNEISGAIRINLYGREPAGIVLPGEEYERICNLLTQELLALRIPETAERLVEAVIRTDKAYPGEHRSELPDLFVIWSRRSLIGGAQSRSVGTLYSPAPAFRTGNHTEGGFYLGVGPRTLPGRDLGAASILDLAPTVAALLHTSLLGAEGKPIRRLCEGSAPLSRLE
ncbi:MAG TPA: alkaline phosphatase family protein [Bryobacteraceae bacterium]|nr:alkaline phosphatase family protein [Bryobacteraceae bacterium]